MVFNCTFTPAGVGSNFAAINRRMSQASAGQPATVVRCFLFLTTLYNSRIQIQSYLCHIQILFISNILGAIAVVIIAVKGLGLALWCSTALSTLFQ
jgi:hypothetical protein